MKTRFLLFWTILVAMWLALVGSLAIGDVLLGGLAALAAVMGIARLEPPATGFRRPWLAFRLLGVVLLDIVRSNIAVGMIVLRPELGARSAGFLDIPLEARNPAALAALACIVTSTPGTSWARYDSHTNVLTLHVLDLVDDAEIVQMIKERYERPLMEIFP